MLNIVIENPSFLNVWGYHKVYSMKEDNCYSVKHKTLIPKFLQLQQDLTFHTSADGLDNFIYPVVMHEPFIQARSLTANQSDFGFWGYISENVIKGLREKRGWIIVDIFSEPISQSDFNNLFIALSDSSQFPNDRVLLNTTSPHFTDNNDRVFNYPSFLEMGCMARRLIPGTELVHAPCLCKGTRSKKFSYPHRRFLLLNNHIDYYFGLVLRKYAKKYSNSFLDSSNEVYKATEYSSTFLRLPDALYETDLNLVLEAYVDDSLGYPFITEKTFMNIHYKKPFIIVGQQHTLASFRKRGYQTFHPLIDESYDEIENTKVRSFSVLKEINRLREMSDDEWTTFLHNCKPIVEHNYNNLLSRIKQTNTWLEGLKDL